MLRVPFAIDLVSVHSSDLMVGRTLPYACHPAIRDLYAMELCARGFSCFDHLDGPRPMQHPTCKRKITMRPCVLPESPDVLIGLGYFVRVSKKYPNLITVRWGPDACKFYMHSVTGREVKCPLDLLDPVARVMACVPEISRDAVKLKAVFTLDERRQHFYKASRLYWDHLNNYNCKINPSALEACGSWKMGF